MRAEKETRALRARIALLESVIENFPGGICLFDESLTMVLCNRRQRDMLDYPEALWAEGDPSMERLLRFKAERGEYGPGEVAEQVSQRMELARARTPHRYDRTRPDGRVLEVRGLPLAGGGFVTTYVDVTEQRRDQATIAHMAHHDPLTGLPNRALFADRLAIALAQVRRGGLMAVHYIDLDGFKPVNDRLGHAAGDELLTLAARRLRASLRESDTLARLGGDEFAVVQTALQDAPEAASLARRLVALMEAPFRLAAGEVTIGASVGVALAPRDGATGEALLAGADAALYRAKTGGRGRFELLD